MSRIPKVRKKYFIRVTSVVDAITVARETSEAETAMALSAELAEDIVLDLEKATTVEQLLDQEVILQDLDRLSAFSPDDLTSIDNAERDYRQLRETVEQMRVSPAAYFQANISIRETRGDYRKMPRSRGLQQIQSNIARLRNRSSFAPLEQRLVWDARIKLAGKTETLLRALHKNLVQEYERLGNPA